MCCFTFRNVVSRKCAVTVTHIHFYWTLMLWRAWGVISQQVWKWHEVEILDTLLIVTLSCFLKKLRAWGFCSNSFKQFSSSFFFFKIDENLVKTYRYALFIHNKTEAKDRVVCLAAKWAKNHTLVLKLLF